MLTINCGPMYSGKTTKLINMYNSNNNDFRKLVIDYNIQNDNTEENQLINHDKQHIPCIRTKHLTQLFSDKSYSTKIGTGTTFYINEAQFFTDLKDFVLKLLQMNKTVHLYGLDGDFQQNKMGQILDLIPYCDSISKLKGKCNNCNNKAIFSKRITSSLEQYLTDETAYIPLCRKCFYKL
tara:strand:+ start:168 stop:707 length:540 start_codon:yes stop_codon:yes gene_type:complete